jgi:ABC-type polysaccharide transport system permease subunit
MEDDRFSIKRMLKIGIPTLLPIILVIAIISGSLLFLDYVHVFSGASWTGMDLFMGLFFSFVMRGLDNKERVEVSKRLTPMMLFLCLPYLQ